MEQKFIPSWKPVTHLATSPYRQIIGEKSLATSLGNSLNLNFFLEEFEFPKTWFVIKPRGVNGITAITNHPLTEVDSYAVSTTFAMKPKIFFSIKAKWKKPTEMILSQYDAKLFNGHIEGYKHLEVGDKLSNLHGQKGVISEVFEPDRFEVIPEEIESDVFVTKKTSVKEVEVLMNYNSLVKRGAFGIFAEISLEGKQPINADFGTIETGYIYDKKTDTFHQAVFGNIHYLIQDKLAFNIANIQATVDDWLYRLFINSKGEPKWIKLKSKTSL